MYVIDCCWWQIQSLASLSLDFDDQLVQFFLMFFNGNFVICFFAVSLLGLTLKM